MITTPSTRHNIDRTAVLSMVVACFFLGLQQVTLKASGQDIAPVLQLSLRSLVALIFVLIYGFYSKSLQFDKKQIGLGLFVGALFAAEFLFLGEALRHTTASKSVVFLYTSPLFSALLLHFLVAEERLNPKQWLGMLLAFFGIAIAFLTKDDGNSSLFGDFLALMAGLSWGLTTVIIRKTALSTLPAKTMLCYQLIMVFILLMIYAIITGQSQMIFSPMAVASLAYQSIVVAFGISMLWFWLLGRYRSADIGALVLMTPIFGVLLSAILLNEMLTVPFIIGAVMVILGLFVVVKR